MNNNNSILSRLYAKQDMDRIIYFLEIWGISKQETILTVLRELYEQKNKKEQK